MRESECGCGRKPCIIIPGIGQSKVVEVNENGETVRSLWPFDFEVGPMIKKLVAPALLSLITRRDCGFSKIAGRAVEQALEPLSCNPDSTRRRRARVVDYPYSLARCSGEERDYILKMVPLLKLAQSIGEDHLFYFAYDVFGSISENARLLHDFIALVKRQTGHRQVNLIPVSMGAGVAQMYLSLYADDRDVHRVVGVVPAYDGSCVISDLLLGRFSLDDPGELFTFLLGEGDSGRISAALSHLPRSVTQAVVEEMIHSALRAVMLNSSSMWGLVPAGDYEQLRQMYLTGPERTELCKQTDAHYRVRRDIKKFVAELESRSVEFFNLCGCGRLIMGLSASDRVNSDSVLPTSSASMGAFCAPVGESFDENYEQRCRCCGRSHISPRRDIDASCAAVPDRSWFYYDMQHEHAAYNENLLSLVRELLVSEERLDVFSNPDYPQFSVYEDKRDI